MELVAHVELALARTTPIERPAEPPLFASAMRMPVPLKLSACAMKRLALFAVAFSGITSLRTMEPQPFLKVEVLSAVVTLSPTFVQSALAAYAAPRVNAATAAVKSKRFMSLSPSGQDCPKNVGKSNKLVGKGKVYLRTLPPPPKSPSPKTLRGPRRNPKGLGAKP